MVEANVRQHVLAVESELDFLRAQRENAPRHGPGKKAAVVVIDLQRLFMDNDDPVAKATMDANVVLLEKAREKGVSVLLVRNVFDSLDEANPALQARHVESLKGLLRTDARSEIMPVLGPKEGDLVVEKKHASGFAGSELKSELDELGADTVYITGTSTSGCVRASCIEGAALGFRMILVEDAVHEQRPMSGPVALAELADRYADVVTLNEALEYMDAL